MPSASWVPSLALGTGYVKRYGDTSLKQFLTLFCLVLMSGCTTISTLNYEATTNTEGGFAIEDLKKIDASCKSKVPDSPGSCYIAKNQSHWDIVTVEHSEDKLSISVTRLSKYLRDFSEGWKQKFVSGMKEVIQNATNKPVKITQLSP